jgi:hypothetical protein
LLEDRKNVGGIGRRITHPVVQDCSGHDPARTPVSTFRDRAP